MLCYGHPDEDNIHRDRVGLMMSKKAMKSLKEWEPVSARIIAARFESKFQNVTIIQCYAPTNQADEEDKENFYEELQSIVDKTPKSDVTIVMGDLNAKIGSNNQGREKIMGKHGLGDKNENGDLFLDFCEMNELVVGGSVFPHRDMLKVTWKSPDHVTENQIDHITISKRWRRILEDVRSKRGADEGTDHVLVVTKLRIKIAKVKKEGEERSPKYNIIKLQQRKVQEEFRVVLSNRFEALASEDDGTIEGKWKRFKTSFTESSEEVLGHKKNKQKEWLSENTW